MRKVLTVVTLSFLASAVYGQEGVKLKSAELSFGDSAFTSGLNVSLLFSLKNNRSMELVGNSDRFYTTLNFKVSDKLSLDATGGVFKKLPWIGPRVVYTPIKPVTFIYWSGVSAGRVGELRAEAKSFYQQFSLYYATPGEHLLIGYNIVKFDKYETTMLPEVAYYFKLMKDLRLGVSATYDTEARKPLFCMSLKYTLPKK